MDITTLIFIIIVNGVSFIFGLFFIFEVVDAFIHRKNLMKYQGTFVNIILFLIIIPFIFTTFMLQTSEQNIFSSKEQPQYGIGLETKNSKSLNNKISIKNQNNIGEKIEINVNNDLNESKELFVNLNCINENKKCNKLIEENEISDQKILVKPKSLIELPLVLNIEEENRNSSFEFEFILIEENGEIYDMISIDLNIE